MFDVQSHESMLARKAAKWIIQIVAWFIACAVAWSFSGFWMVLVMYMLMQLLMYFASWALNLAVQVLVSDNTFHAAGAAVHNFFSKFKRGSAA